MEVQRPKEKERPRRPAGRAPSLEDLEAELDGLMVTREEDEALREERGRAFQEHQEELQRTADERGLVGEQQDEGELEGLHDENDGGYIMVGADEEEEEDDDDDEKAGGFYDVGGEEVPGSGEAYDNVDDDDDDEKEPGFEAVAAAQDDGVEPGNNPMPAREKEAAFMARVEAGREPAPAEHSIEEDYALASRLARVQSEQELADEELARRLQEEEEREPTEEELAAADRARRLKEEEDYRMALQIAESEQRRVAVKESGGSDPAVQMGPGARAAAAMASSTPVAARGASVPLDDRKEALEDDEALARRLHEEEVAEARRAEEARRAAALAVVAGKNAESSGPASAPERNLARAASEDELLARRLHEEDVAERQKPDVPAPGKGYEAVHEQLMQLHVRERETKADAQMLPSERGELLESMFHQKMQLLMQLPPAEQSIYHMAIAGHVDLVGDAAAAAPVQQQQQPQQQQPQLEQQPPKDKKKEKKKEKKLKKGGSFFGLFSSRKKKQRAASVEDEDAVEDVAAVLSPKKLPPGRHRLSRSPSANQEEADMMMAMRLQRQEQEEARLAREQEEERKRAGAGAAEGGGERARGKGGRFGRRRKGEA